MAGISIERRRAIRKVETRRDDLMAKQKKIKEDLAATKAALKTMRRAR